MNREIDIDLQVEVCYPVSNLFIVLINEGETTVLLDGKQSKPYDSYLFRKVMSITKGYTLHDNVKHFMVFVDILNDCGDIEEFLIRSISEKGLIVFESNSETNDTPFSRFILINYQEYLELKQSFEEKDLLLFKDFVKLKSSRSKSELNSRFCMPPYENNQFISENGLTYFLDLQESDKSKIFKEL